MSTGVMRSAAIALLLVTGACKKSEDPPATKAPACQGTHTTGAITWFEDDFDAAARCAVERKLPILIDEWAPWCHTCISMQTYVFTDPSLAPFADRFVFLAADTDKAVNAPVVEAYPPAAWPTFFVVSPEGELLGRYVGAASVQQFRDFLAESERAHLDQAAADPGTALGQLVLAERATVRRDWDAAIAAYDAALAKAPADWPRRADVLVSRLSAIAKRGPARACAEAALRDIDATGKTASATDFVAHARNCADDVAAEDPALAQQVRERGAARLAALVDDAAAPLSADDRGDAMMYLRMLYDDLGKPEQAVALAERQRAFLDEAAAKAPDAFAAMTYNWPRAEVYAYLGKPLELVPAIEKSAADLPKEYDPPYRLAFLYKEAGKIDEAIPWAKKAADLAYGPRKVRAQRQYADLLRAKGDAAAELEARRALVTILEELPPGHQQPEALEQAKIDLAALEAVVGATP